MQQLITAANGVPVYSYRQPHLHTFTIGLYVKAGVLYERPEETGITHFLEHVLFRNLGGMPQRELYERLAGMGATFDACTYKEFMEFTISAASSHFDGCAALIARLLAPLSVSARDVVVERRRVQNEIREDDPLKSFDHFAGNLVWGGTALCRPISGTVTGVAALGLEALQAAWEQSFRVGHLCFYVTGNYTGENLARLVEVVGGYAIGQSAEERRNNAPVPPGFLRRDCLVALQDRKDMPEVQLSFDADFSRYTMAEINLLDELLFRGMLSRMSMALSEDRGLIYSHSAYLEQYRNIGTCYIKYNVMLSKLEESLRVAADVFRSVKESITEEELALHRPKYADNYAYTLDDPDDLNWNMAYHNFILNDRLESIDQVRGLYAAVTAERLMEISREIFRPENLVVAIRAKKVKCKPDQIRGIFLAL